MFNFEVPIVMSLLGFLCGVGLGVVTRQMKFCTFGAIEDTVLAGRTQRIKVWLLAILTSVVVVQFYRYFDNSRITESFYLAPQFNIMGAIVGGLMFGFGMSLVGTCAYGSIIRLGGGDLRALVVAIIIGITGYITMSGIASVIRVEVIETFSLNFSNVGSQGILEIITYMTRIEISSIFLVVSLFSVLGIIFWLYFDKDFNKSFSDILSGIAIGALIATGFVITSSVGNDAFSPQPVESLAYVRPLGESLVYLMTYSGAVINFSIGSIFGTLFGAFAVSYFRNEIRLEAFDDTVEMKRHLVGAMLMGFGAVTASGCTIGQGISAMAILALNAPIALLSIFIGAVLGLNYLLTDSLSEMFQNSISNFKKLLFG